MKLHHLLVLLSLSITTWATLTETECFIGDNSPLPEIVIPYKEQCMGSCHKVVFAVPNDQNITRAAGCLKRECKETGKCDELHYQGSHVYACCCQGDKCFSEEEVTNFIRKDSEESGYFERRTTKASDSTMAPKISSVAETDDDKIPTPPKGDGQASTPATSGCGIASMSYIFLPFIAN